MNIVTRTAKKSPRFIAIGLLITLVSSIVLASRWDSLSAFAFSFGADAQAEQKTRLASASKNTPNLESLLKPGETTIDNFVSPATTTLISPTGAGGFENGATFAVTTQRLIFTWQNDTSGGVDPPAAVDNISLTSTAPVPVCGTRTVGPTGNYASLTAAFADLNLNGVCGTMLLELQAAYASGVETFPIVAGNIPNNSPANTI